MADNVQVIMERMVPELEDLVERGIFTQPEIQSIVKKRRDFEYLLVKRKPVEEDFVRYLEYELNLETLRLARKARLSLKKVSVSDHAGMRRIHFIFNRACNRFRGSLKWWLQWLDYCLRIGSEKAASKVLGRAIQLHPRAEVLWLQASEFEFDVQHNLSAARAILQRGLRINKESHSLWRAYFRLELVYILKMKGRRTLLGLSTGSSSSGLLQGSESLLSLASLNKLEASEENNMDVDVTDSKEGALSDVVSSVGPETSQEKTESENPAMEAFFSGAVPRIIYDQAVSTSPKDLELRISLLEELDNLIASVAAEADSSEALSAAAFPSLSAHIFQSIASDFGDVPRAWDVLLSRSLSSVLYEFGRQGTSSKVLNEEESAIKVAVSELENDDLFVMDAGDASEDAPTAVSAPTKAEHAPEKALFAEGRCLTAALPSSISNVNSLSDLIPLFSATTVDKALVEALELALSRDAVRAARLQEEAHARMKLSAQRGSSELEYLLLCGSRGLPETLPHHSEPFLALANRQSERQSSSSKPKTQKRARSSSLTNSNMQNDPKCDFSLVCSGTPAHLLSSHERVRLEHLQTATDACRALSEQYLSATRASSKEEGGALAHAKLVDAHATVVRVLASVLPLELGSSEPAARVICAVLRSIADTAVAALDALKLVDTGVSLERLSQSAKSPSQLLLVHAGAIAARLVVLGVQARLRLCDLSGALELAQKGVSTLPEESSLLALLAKITQFTVYIDHLPLGDLNNDSTGSGELSSITKSSLSPLSSLSLPNQRDTWTTYLGNLCKKAVSLVPSQSWIIVASLIIELSVIPLLEVANFASAKSDVDGDEEKAALVAAHEKSFSNLKSSLSELLVGSKQADGTDLRLLAADLITLLRSAAKSKKIDTSVLSFSAFKSLLDNSSPLIVHTIVLQWLFDDILLDYNRRIEFPQSQKKIQRLQKATIFSMQAVQSLVEYSLSIYGELSVDLWVLAYSLDMQLTKLSASTLSVTKKISAVSKRALHTLIGDFERAEFTRRITLLT